MNSDKTTFCHGAARIDSYVPTNVLIIKVFWKFWPFLTRVKFALFFVLAIVPLCLQLCTTVATFFLPSIGFRSERLPSRWSPVRWKLCLSVPGQKSSLQKSSCEIWIENKVSLTFSLTWNNGITLESWMKWLGLGDSFGHFWTVEPISRVATHPQIALWISHGLARSISPSPRPSFRYESLESGALESRSLVVKGVSGVSENGG